MALLEDLVRVPLFARKQCGGAREGTVGELTRGGTIAAVGGDVNRVHSLLASKQRHSGPQWQGLRIQFTRRKIARNETVAGDWQMRLGTVSKWQTLRVHVVTGYGNSPYAVGEIISGVGETATGAGETISCAGEMGKTDRETDFWSARRQPALARTRAARARRFPGPASVQD